jgi:hypothetical protein
LRERSRLHTCSLVLLTFLQKDAVRDLDGRDVLGKRVRVELSSGGRKPGGGGGGYGGGGGGGYDDRRDDRRGHDDRRGSPRRARSVLPWPCFDAALGIAEWHEAVVSHASALVHATH